jgi:hypothetical protein
MIQPSDKSQYIRLARSIAKSRKGKCLSKVCNSKREKLQWACSSGHKWKQCLTEVQGSEHSGRKGTWCPLCAGNKKKDLKFYQNLAKERGGRCLSKNYTNSKQKGKWKCLTHKLTWQATFGSVSAGRWCQLCANQKRSDQKKQQINLRDVREVAKALGGKCLSKEGILSTPLTWECAHGHRWNALFYRVKVEGTWCPECATGFGERVVRHYFEQCFQTTFSRSRPKWLRNTKSGKPLELDGYNEDLKLAFEHHGGHHYGLNNEFTRSKKEQRNLEARDKLKIRLLKLAGIRLIVVPEVPRLLKLNELPDFLENHFERVGVNPAVSPVDVKFDPKKAYSPNSVIMMERLRKKVKSLGGKVIGDYINARSLMEFICKDGHKFKNTPDKIMGRGQWCRKCYERDAKGKYRTNIDDLKKMVAAKGGRVFSKKYAGVEAKVLIECGKGHQWLVRPASIFRGLWCQLCVAQINAEKMRLGIVEMQKIAEKRGGTCLSDVYVNGKVKLLWRCKLGHEWEALPINIKNKGSWCPYCSGRRM